ncbi:MAG: hypothetical protein BWZ02_00911 [Lentisphaerae bacterium ADurb.BinA184]|nr:MAG: hypothetical protein BWZ02_00911 [Lentisphaerae bacterium ADurb.BinA184]
MACRHGRAGGVLLFWAALTAQAWAGTPVGTAFTYQGQLRHEGLPVTGLCDLAFTLWDADTDGTQVGTTATVTDVAVTEGLFTVVLDFGQAFAGDARWLETTVTCPAGTGTPTVLTPRQRVTATPCAQFAQGAPWSGLTDLPPGFADGVDNDADTTYAAGTGLELAGTVFAIAPQGVGTPQIADSAVTTLKLAAGAVTLNHLAAGVLAWGNLANLPPGFADGVDNDADTTYAAGTGLELAGTVFAIAPQGVGTPQIADSAVTTLKLAAGAVTLNHLAAGVLAWGNLANLPPGFADGVDNDADTTYAAGTGLELAGTVFAIAPLGVGTPQIADSAVTTLKLATGAVTLNHLAAGVLAWGNLANLPPGFADGVDNDSGGDISAVHAGNGLTGGGEAGDVSLHVGPGPGIEVTDNTVALAAAFADGSAFDARFVNEGQPNSVTAGMIEPDIVSSLNAVRSDGGNINLLAGDGITITSDPVDRSITIAAAPAATSAWTLTGNGGTDPAAHFLGTTDNQTLVLRANGEAALRLEPRAASPNLIGGHAGNSVTVRVSGAVIAGGGAEGDVNHVAADFGTVSGGSGNQAGARHTAVGGGEGNLASAPHASVGGGWMNRAEADYATVAGGGPSDPSSPAQAADTNNRVHDDYGVISGGAGNRAGNPDGDTASRRWSTVAGGFQNSAGDAAGVPTTTMYALPGADTVGGGENNQAYGGASTVAGGILNKATGRTAFVGGGFANRATGDGAVAAGGLANTAHGAFATVAGGGPTNTGELSWESRGAGNVAYDDFCAIGGGGGNRAGSDDGTTQDTTNTPFATVGGGQDNTATGLGATVPGGIRNQADGSYSFAAGYQAQANHTGAFVWSDATGGGAGSYRDNEFAVHATNGLRVETSNSDYGIFLRNQPESGGGDGLRVYTRCSQGVGWGAIYAINTGTSPVIYARNDGTGPAAYFGGNVHVAGTLSKSAGSFTIDHPLEPLRKTLSHSFVESPDMMNVYNGNVVLDADGQAWVELPQWFEALNRDFRYQLTAVGGPGPNLHIAAEVAGNRFRIAGGTAGLKVSWQLTGIRQDAYANAHRIRVEQDKPAELLGALLCPGAGTRTTAAK